MKLIVMAMSLALAASALPAAAATPIEITVTGQGNVTRSPDIATFSASIVTNDDSAQTATSANNATYGRFVAAMRALGVRDADIFTTYYNVNYQPHPPPQPVGVAPDIQPAIRYGFVVNRNLSVRLRNVALAGRAIDASVGAGVTNFDGIEFGTADNRGAYAQALRSAVGDAESQAKAMAGAAHLHLLGIKSINQGSPVVRYPMMMRAASSANTYAPNPPTTLPPSSVTTNATVTIVYLASQH